MMNDEWRMVGNSAFSECSSLANVTLAEGIQSIGRSAFYNCDSLTGITLPETLTGIGDHAFEYCDNLRKSSLFPDISVV